MSVLFSKEKKNSGETVLDNRFIAEFMPSAPELAVKAYIYGLMLANGNGGEGGDICVVLGCDEHDLRAAFSYWQASGLVTVISEEPLKICFRNEPAGIISPASASGYSELIAKVQAVLGTRVLSGSELSRIYDWVEVFGLEQEAAVEIVKHCLDKKGARTSVAYMDSVAKTLAAGGELTLEAVKEHFRYEEILSSGAAGILRRWNRRGAPTEDQIALYEKWTKAWGFDEQSIDAALIKMTAAEKPSFAYLDGILDEWHKNGSVSIERIREMQREDDMTAELAREAFARAGLKRRPNTEDRQLFREWNRNRAISAELIYYAAERAKLDPKPYASMKKTVEAIYAEGISSVSAAKEFLDSPRGAAVSRRTRKNDRALNYLKSGGYSSDELKKLGISLGEEFYDDEQE